MNRVGFGPRLGAFLIDVVIVIVISTIIGWFSGSFSRPTSGMMAPSTGSIVAWIFGLAYWLIEGLTGASPGKRILKLIIRNQNGGPADQNTLLKRYVLKSSATILMLLGNITTLGFIIGLSYLVGLAVFVGCFLVLGQKRQALHDILAGTAVFPAAARPMSYTGSGQSGSTTPPPPPPPQVG